ncbi:MAG: phosphotransferase [Gemmataceae bacterium]
MYELDHGQTAVALRPAPPARSKKATGLDPFVLRKYDPANGADVSEALLGYLTQRHGDKSIRFCDRPAYIPNGWETHTYAFRVEAADHQPQELRGPLVIRIYSSPQGLPRAWHEFEIQRHLIADGFPAPAAKVLEEDCTLFGGPFLIMEQVQGLSLVDFLSRNPLWLWPAAYQMALTQIKLHRLPTEKFPAPSESFLNRRLEEIEELVEEYNLPGLAPGLTWLKEHRPQEPDKPSILHLDYHPLNLMRPPDGALAVLDWPEADIGDFHADFATSLMLMACCPVGDSSLFDQILLPIGRSLLRMWYAFEYKKRMPVDAQKLSYYKALAALRRLAGYGRWLDASPLSTGCKPSSIRYLCPHHLKTLQAYFRKNSGVGVSLIRE